MKILADLGQQAHDDEFRGADAEGTGGQSKQCCRHENVLVKIPRRAEL
jgi:hypothetical protein